MAVGVLVEVGDGVIGVAVSVGVRVGVAVGAMITVVGVATCNASPDWEVNSPGAKTRDGEALPTT